MQCDYCQHYKWYWDWCEKWKCEVDAREIHGCFEKKLKGDGHDYDDGKRRKDQNFRR